MLFDYGGYHMEVTTHTMLEMTKLWGLSWAMRDGITSNTELTKE